ncbi:hypothetical protein RND71_008082 [Anisodus tanguticus]|uniref:Uncharacterized protein n=1 Tax=Anisodus tanguticus TaxID=243964 RepID=A0AAE1QMZ5_9SOLA|nr:hypothetical protein RND71_044211 [Anisodus tanguticus]KAK4372698.1 hypothetical protein RND71_008082 [Anisodus tanguticus]
MVTDSQIAEYILSMGLSVALSVYIAFRAGRRLRGLTPENMEERLSDFTFDSLKGLISDKLEELLGSQGLQLPAQVSIQDVAAHLHQDVEDLGVLRALYDSLLELGIQSPYYIEAHDHVIRHIDPQKRYDSRKFDRREQEQRERNMKGSGVGSGSTLFDQLATKEKATGRRSEI